MKRHGKAAFAHRLDLRDTARLAAFLDTAVATLGGLDPQSDEAVAQVAVGQAVAERLKEGFRLVFEFPEGTES